MQCAGAGAQHEQCSLHHILMVQSGACLPHCYLWPHERSPHLWPIFTALLRRASKQKRLCVPAAALWSRMTSAQNIPAGGGTLSRLRCSMMMLAGPGGGAGGGPGGGAPPSPWQQHAETSLHLQEAGRPTPGETLPL